MRAPARYKEPFEANSGQGKHSRRTPARARVAKSFTVSLIDCRPRLRATETRAHTHVQECTRRHDQVSGKNAPLPSPPPPHTHPPTHTQTRIHTRQIPRCRAAPRHKGHAQSRRHARVSGFHDGCDEAAVRGHRHRHVHGGAGGRCAGLGVPVAVDLGHHAQRLPRRLHHHVIHRHIRAHGLGTRCSRSEHGGGGAAARATFQAQRRMLYAQCSMLQAPGSRLNAHTGTPDSPHTIDNNGASCNPGELHNKQCHLGREVRY